MSNQRPWFQGGRGELSPRVSQIDAAAVTARSGQDKPYTVTPCRGRTKGGHPCATRANNTGFCPVHRGQRSTAHPGAAAGS